MFWSVIIPTKSPARYLDQALHSVKDQLIDGEILVQLNPSTPRSASFWPVWCDVEANPTDLGCYGSVNAAIKRAKGQYIHVLHDDDWVLPDFYSSMGGLVRLHEGPSPRLLSCDYQNLDQQSQSLNFQSRLHKIWDGDFKASSDRMSEALTKGNPFQVASVVFPRIVFEEAGYFREDMPYAADWEFYARILRSFNWAHLHKDLARYRVHPDQRAWDMLRDGRAVRDVQTARHLCRIYHQERLKDATRTTV